MIDKYFDLNFVKSVGEIPNRSIVHVEISRSTPSLYFRLNFHGCNTQCVRENITLLREYSICEVHMFRKSLWCI
jgi:hypothetical protein